MLKVRALPVSREEEPFISLEDSRLVLADVRAGLPQLRKELKSRWPFIQSVEVENRQITRRRNPHDPTQVFAVLGIAIYISTRTARIFFDEVARGAGKKVGPAVGKHIVEALEYVRRWIKRMEHTSPALKPKLVRERVRKGVTRKSAKKKAH